MSASFRRGLAALSAAAFGIAAFCMPLSATAQDYPNRPIRLLVDGPAGGVNDIWARRYGQRISESLGQPVVVDNRPGASGSIAAEALARSAPDGYTMFFGGMNPLVAFPGAGGQVRYDPAKDFTAVGVGTLGYPMLVVYNGTGIKTVADLIAQAKAKPEELICGTSGHAGLQHFACVYLEQMLGIKLRTVPYKGSSAALLDAANGAVQIAIGYASELEPLTTPGKLVAIAALSPNRMPKYPSAPTLAEAGYPGLDLIAFSGFFVPAGTPRPIVDKLNVATIKAMQRPEMTEWLKSLGGTYEPLNPDDFAKLVAREQAKWKKMSAETGIKVE
ncbi:MAG: tripartite tricarboxylate transporter substrate binding protein [Burkholderiaceae bacterium]